MSQPHIALVTGAGRGIGAAIARRLAREGVAVLVAARGHEACAEVAAAILASGGTAWPLELDVGDRDSIERATTQARELVRERGPIDWLVNNAGIAETAPFIPRGDKGSVDLYERHLSINFHGARRMIDALVPGMIERRYGRVVNMGSSASLQGYPYAAAYAASKHALLGYSRSAALELARTGVTLNVVCPHYVDSPMTDRSTQRIVEKTGKTASEVRSFFAAQNAGNRLITPEEVAEAVWTLVSEGRNGWILEMDGAQTHAVETLEP